MKYESMLKNYRENLERQEKRLGETFDLTQKAITFINNKNLTQEFCQFLEGCLNQPTIEAASSSQSQPQAGVMDEINSVMT